MCIYKNKLSNLKKVLILIEFIKFYKLINVLNNTLKFLNSIIQHLTTQIYILHYTIL